MPTRIALLVLMLLPGLSVGARAQVPSSAQLCRQARPTVRDLWRLNQLDAPPAVSALMVDVIDGRLPQVRRQLAQFEPAQASHWRQLAMLTAAYAGQAVEVDALLDDGAEVDGMVWIPTFKSGFYRQIVNNMKQDPRFDGAAGIDRLAAAGVLKNRGQHYGPALTIVAGCGDVATMDVLLRHHAHVMARAAPNVADALTAATIDGDAVIVQRLLEHGADACMDDRLGRQRVRSIKHKFVPLAEVGRRAGLPADLTARLACPATASVH